MTSRGCAQSWGAEAGRATCNRGGATGTSRRAVLGPSEARMVLVSRSPARLSLT